MSRTGIFMAAIGCSILGASIGLAQELYLTANAGYRFGAGTQQLGTYTTYMTATTSYEGVYGSYGEGFTFGASAGYMFGNNLGVELGFAYWLEKTFGAGYTSPTAWQKLTYSGSGWVFVPSMVVSANAVPVNPYARLGLVLGVLEYEEDVQNQQGTQSSGFTIEETGNLAIGYAGALGILVPAGGTIGFFVEADIQSVTYSPKQSETTRYTVNGVDQLPSLKNKVFQYKDSISSDQEGVALAGRIPFSSVGLVVGVRVNL